MIFRVPRCVLKGDSTTKFIKSCTFFLLFCKNIEKYTFSEWKLFKEFIFAKKMLNFEENHKNTPFFLPKIFKNGKIIVYRVITVHFRKIFLDFHINSYFLIYLPKGAKNVTGLD